MSGKLTFPADSSDSETEIEIKINEKYATAYNLWRNKEELQKYKDLKKEEDSESSSESEEEELPDNYEFFRALSLIESKDPRLFEEGFELFKNEEVGKKSKTVKEKPMYMKDYERNLVERGGKFSDEDEDVPSKVPTYDEEQEDLKKSFKKALEDSDVEEDFLQVRSKTKKEEEAGEADYSRWLKGEDIDVSEDTKKDMSFLRNYWNDPELDENEKFLRDYFLDKKYLEEDDSERPTYEEITSGMLSDEEKMLEEHEKFEHKYNFRYEEPDEEFIKRYPRTVGDSLRKADNRRKQKREGKAERKRREKEQRQEELKRLKALKRKEIEEKFSKLKDVCGQDEINLNESDFESDFDPDKHDQKMKELFNDDYYNIEEGQKPEFPYDEELESENWNTWIVQKVIGTEDFNQKTDDNEINSPENDEAIDQSKICTNPKEEFEREMIEATLPKRKPKKKSLFAKVVSQPKPMYDPDGKSFDEYLDEYYKLDYEDVIGDMPVRYKYRKVVPNNFGLTVDEILAADDRELNKWCSIKKTCQYRNDDEELYDVQAFKKKAQNMLTKKKVFTSLYAPKDENDTEVEVKSQMKNHFAPEACSSTSIDSENIEIDIRQSNTNEDVEQESNKDSSTEYNEYKKKSKKKKGKANSSLVTTESDYSNSCYKNTDMEYDTNKNDLESSNAFQCNNYEDEEDKLLDNNSSVHNEHKEKSKKKKQNKKQNTPNVKAEYEYSDRTDNTEEYFGENNKELSNLGESSSHKKSKRKTELDEDFALSAKESNSKRKRDDSNFTNKSSHTSKNNHPSSFNNSLCVKSSPNSNSVAESSSQELTRKKKKNKRKNKNDSSNNVLDYNQSNKSKTHKFSKKHTEQVSGDKRLGLTDERLAAYGINPKKFKNRIIYSKK